MDISKIRNFAIIAHIDHGKSTLADRFLEITKTLPKEKIKEQTLDRMDLERERGITIKLTPVRMLYKYVQDVEDVQNVQVEQLEQAKRYNNLNNSEYVLNLIDTPGHVDFTYEVSRSLAAVEGAVLLVDATQGIQAQTLTNLALAKEQNLAIIPVINKIDLPGAEIERVSEEITSILKIPKSEILLASAKEGTGVSEILDRIVEKVPPPVCQGREPCQEAKALVFDSTFSSYKGVLVFVRVFSGEIKKGDQICFMATKKAGEALEVGFFSPDFKETEKLQAGEIGYIVTGLKEVSEAKVGDTITTINNSQLTIDKVKPLPGYKKINSFVYASLYSTTGEPHELREALEKLRLNDSSLAFEPENSPALGSGFRVGFLGLLHLDIVRERLEREYNQDLIITTPSVSYKIIKDQGPSTSLRTGGKEIIIKGANEMPEPGTFLEIQEPIVKLEIITPSKFLGPVMELAQSRRGEYKTLDYIDSKTALLTYEIPLAEIIVDFYDELKSISSGYASLSYEFVGYKKADLVKMDILVAGEIIPPLSLIVPREKADSIGREIVKKLKETIPRQLFSVALQAAVGGKILAREDIPPLRKDVTGHLYGGDVTRKRKLLEKQKKGKKRLKRFGKVDIPQEAFLAILKK